MEQMKKYSKDKELGAIEIAPEVIESIAGIVAAQVKGFYPVPGLLNTIFGGKELSKGAYLTEENGAFVIDIYGNVDYGVSIPKIALLLQNKIKEQLLFSCELEISQVNIHVQTIIPAKNVDSEFFELGDEE